MPPITESVSFRWSLDTQMSLIGLDLNSEEDNSPGALMAFKKSTECCQVRCSYTDCSFVPVSSHYVCMPFMMAEEDATGKSRMGRVKQTQLFSGLDSLPLFLRGT